MWNIHWKPHPAVQLNASRSRMQGSTRHCQHSNGTTSVHRSSWVTLATNWTNLCAFLDGILRYPSTAPTNRHNMINNRISLNLYYMKTLFNALHKSLSDTFTQIYIYLFYIMLFIIKYFYCLYTYGKWNKTLNQDIFALLVIVFNPT